MMCKVLLSIPQQAYRELLQHSLQRQQGVDIVGQSCNYIECLTIIAQQQPRVWIHSAEDDADLRLAMERAYEIAPGLVVVRVNPDEPAGYLQVRLDSIGDVLGFADQWNAEPAYSAWQ